MSKFKFPQNPGTKRANPFEDERGDNPFSDGSPAPSEPVAENLFETPAETADRPYLPGDFEAILVPNASRALGLALFGLVTSALGAVGAGLAIAGSGVWSTPLLFALPVQFAASAAAVPACILARRDLRAIRAGAMRGESRGKSRLAFWLGAGGVTLSTIPIVLYFSLLIIAALAA